MAASDTTETGFALDRRDLSLGSAQLEVTARGTEPAGPAHYVGPDRNPVCGAERVKWTFPGRRLSSTRHACEDCVAAMRASSVTRLVG